jgi:hypothetical protein
MRKSARLRGKFFWGWIHAAVYGPEPVAHFSRFQNFFASHTVFAVLNGFCQASEMLPHICAQSILRPDRNIL